MPKRVPLQSVTVQRTRGGKTTGSENDPLMSFNPRLNEPFDFTDEEIKHLDAVNPGLLGKEVKVDVTTGRQMKAFEDMTDEERAEHVRAQQRGDWGSPPATTEASRAATTEAQRRTQAELQAQAQRDEAQRLAADEERRKKEEADSTGRLGRQPTPASTAPADSKAKQPKGAGDL